MPLKLASPLTKVIHMHVTNARYLIVISLISISGCNQHAGNPAVAEGTIYSLEYKLEDGRTGGFTRLNIAEAVPGGNGSWNVDAKGRLTNDYLIITYPQKKDLGPRIIPAHRLVNIQFGDGGIKSVNENEPAPSD